MKFCGLPESNSLAAYDYTALNHNGIKEKGFLSSDSEDNARRELLARKLSPLSIKLVKQNSYTSFLFQKKISLKNLVLFTRQLSVLLEGGIPLDIALRTIGEQSTDTAVKLQILTLSSRIEEGFSFKEALSEYPQTFDSLYVSLVAAGEAAGALGSILEKIALHLETRSKIQQEVTGALVYPLILIVMCLAIVSLMLVFVVPNVVDQFETLNQELPLITKVLIASSEIIRGSAFWILIGLIGAALFSFKYYGLKRIESYRDKALLKIPVLKGFLINSNLARFTSSLSILRNSNIPIVQAINISLDTVSNSSLKNNLRDALISVSEGASLGSSLGKVIEIPPMVVQMVISGETSGKLEVMLTKAASYLEDEFQQTTRVTLSLLEPLVVVIMGLVVGSIVLAILLPLIQMNSLSVIG
jgi:general secretion pathway protein F|tara:strand:+ start:1289 stop:2533 length:1245 start_codon:yes stop_codon:yes gene_type:complete